MTGRGQLLRTCPHPLDNLLNYLPKPDISILENTGHFYFALTPGHAARKERGKDVASTAEAASCRFSDQEQHTQICRRTSPGKRHPCRLSGLSASLNQLLGAKSFAVSVAMFLYWSRRIAGIRRMRS